MLLSWKNVLKGQKEALGCINVSALQWQRSKDRRLRDTDCSSFSAVIQGSALTIHTHYISAGGLRLQLPNQGVCHCLKRRGEKKKIRGFSGQEPILSVKSIISLNATFSFFFFFYSFFHSHLCLDDFPFSIPLKCIRGHFNHSGSVSTFIK